MPDAVSFNPRYNEKDIFVIHSVTTLNLHTEKRGYLHNVS